MEIGEELKTWLQDKSKEYTARLEFAIKVWQSVDFVYNNKYEVVCQWLSETLSKARNELPVAQLQQLFRLRAQPGLVNVATKSQLIQTLLDRIDKDSQANAHGHAYPQLLQSLINFELVQDALRADYDLLMSSYGILFQTYERQLLQAPTSDAAESQLPARHADFILPLLQQLRDYVQRAQHHKRLLAAYTSAALHPLCQLLLQLRQHNLCCFDQLAAVEQQLTEKLTDSETLQRISEQPLHVQMLVLEALLYNRRFDPHHLYKVSKYIFHTLATEDSDEARPKLVLALATHMLESLRKHNITLQFSEEIKRKPIEYLSNRIMKIVGDYKGQHLAEVLQLLCVALRLNPLILEPNVYQITVWMLTATKQNDTELRMYSDYLVLLLDMFRRLSRAERFVMQLLKSLREWLQKFELTLPNTASGGKDAKRSRKEEEVQLKPVESQLNPYVQLIFKSHLGAADAVQQIAVTSSSRDPLAQSWPAQTAGAAFTRLVSHLMSKPSMVIWKMLLHSFAELLEPQTTAVLPENLNYAIELQATLLSQYLLGTRLAEQVQQFQAELQQQRQHTVQVLQQFGRHLLAQEHNRRTMNSFLECVERACSFELLLAYYWPDGLPATETLHKFLPSDEWELIQQRVHNFGKSLCRQRLQRLELQLVQAGWLLLPNQRGESCPDALVELVPRQLLFHLTRAQKQLRLKQQQQQHRDPEHLLDYVEDEECVELLTLQLLQDYAVTLKAEKVKGVLLPKQLSEEQAEASLDEAALANAIRKHIASSKQPVLPVEATAQLVDALQKLPLAQLVSSIKSRLWLLLFTLYQDVRRAQLAEQEQLLLEQLIDLLHFGQPLPICGYFPQLEELLQLVPIAGDDASASWRFYETLFGRCIRRLTAGSDVFLTNCAEYFRQQMLTESNKLPAEQCRLLLLAIETLSSATGAQARRMQRHLQPLLEIYGQFVAHKFRSVKKTPSAAKEFVQQTLSGFAIYLSSCINRANKQQQEEKAKQAEAEKENKVGQEEEEEGKKKKSKQEKQPEETAIDENLRRICKIYIGHSLNYRNGHAIRLLNVALTHRQQLHLDQDEIEFVLNSYWRQLNADIESESTLDTQAIEPAIKLIIGYKTNEDFLLLLRRLSTQLDNMQRPETEAQHTSLQNILILLGLFSKCSLSSIKGAMLNEHFELISGNVSLRLPAVGDGMAYRNHVMRLLDAQRALAGNRTIPLTGETLDCMLGTMLDVNIKRFIVNGGTWQDFVQLHGAISENCLLLLRQHATLMSDRAAQLTALCQDLIHAIICYRSERKQAQNLTEEELDGLAELALKLVTLMAGIAAGPQALAVKRVAPFLLIFTIKQMVTTERPTTLYEKIKVHLDRICHELIGICDHRAGHFILRASNEAGARIYQNLVKEHDKYHKFRGKV